MNRRDFLRRFLSVGGASSHSSECSNGYQCAPIGSVGCTPMDSSVHQSGHRHHPPGGGIPISARASIPSTDRTKRDFFVIGLWATNPSENAESKGYLFSVAFKYSSYSASTPWCRFLYSSAIAYVTPPQTAHKEKKVRYWPISNPLIIQSPIQRQISKGRNFRHIKPKGKHNIPKSIHQFSQVYAQTQMAMGATTAWRNKKNNQKTRSITICSIMW